tara:strand:- start:255 stop:839 length:585 start_codon:yes stop_codon:yes gene_type:complete
MKKKIILGSSSKFRESLLNTLNIEFESISPNIDESRLSNENPRDMALRLAIEKAKKISSQNSNTIIISSDACAYCDGKILGKPITKDRAIEYLNFISQKIIYFYTSICVMDSSSQNYEIDCAQYEIKIKKLSNEKILEYVKLHKPFQSSAAFRYEVAKDTLIEKFIDKEDDISGLIGLPLKKLQKMLRKFEVNV